MNTSPQMDFKSQSATTISSIIVVNIIWWMLMIAAIGVGATNMGRCPVQPNVPIYLLVLGAASILSLSLTYTQSICESGAVCLMISSCMALLHLFSFGWFIAGTYWVYSVYPPDYSPGTTRYCQKTAFQFAFVVTTILWVTLALSFLCGGCFILVACCKYVSARHRLSPNRGSFYGAIGESQGGAAAGDV